MLTYTHTQTQSHTHTQRDINLRIIKTVPNNKRTVECITIHSFKLYYRAVVIKAVWYRYETR